MKINKLIAAVLFLCLAFSLASAEIAPIPLDAKNRTRRTGNRCAHLRSGKGSGGEFIQQHAITSGK